MLILAKVPAVSSTVAFCTLSASVNTVEKANDIFSSTMQIRYLGGGSFPERVLAIEFGEWLP